MLGMRQPFAPLVSVYGPQGGPHVVWKSFAQGSCREKCLLCWQVCDFDFFSRDLHTDLLAKTWHWPGLGVKVCECVSHYKTFIFQNQTSPVPRPRSLLIIKWHRRPWGPILSEPEAPKRKWMEVEMKSYWATIPNPLGDFLYLNNYIYIYTYKFKFQNIPNRRILCIYIYD